MLELQKLVLQQVSDQKELFKKELLKSLKWLNSEEIVMLKEWVLNQFSNRYMDMINETFYGIEVS
jgi:hypothetical protein